MSSYMIIPYALATSIIGFIVLVAGIDMFYQPPDRHNINALDKAVWFLPPLTFIIAGLCLLSMAANVVF